MCPDMVPCGFVMKGDRQLNEALIMTARGLMASHGAPQVLENFMSLKEVATVEEVNRFIRSTPGSIGYVERRNTDASLKIVLEPAR